MMNFRILVIVLILCNFASLESYAQRNMIFRPKAEATGGLILNSDSKEGMNAGMETALELPLYGDHNWKYTYNFPTIGFALGGFKTQKLSCIDPVIYTYPYLLYPIIHKPIFQMNLKTGFGIATYMQHGDSIEGKVYPVTAIGTVGLNFDITLAKRYGNPLNQWSITFGGNATVLHNGYVTRKCKNFMKLDASLGLKYTPNVDPLPIKDKPKKVRRVLALEGSLQGGMNQLSRDDGDFYYPNASLSLGFYLPITNAWRLGLGGDGMYNSAYDGTQREGNIRYNFIKEEDPWTMFRAGAFLACDFTIDRFVAGAHVGLYLYDKMKVPEYNENGDKNDNLTENFMYQKLVMKYRITKNIFALFQFKTHLTEVECAEIGFGFAVPDFGSRIKHPFGRISFKREDPKELKID